MTDFSDDEISLYLQSKSSKKNSKFKKNWQLKSLHKK